MINKVIISPISKDVFVMLLAFYLGTFLIRRACKLLTITSSLFDIYQRALIMNKVITFPGFLIMCLLCHSLSNAKWTLSCQYTSLCIVKINSDYIKLVSNIVMHIG